MVSIPDRKIALIEDGRVVKVYSIAVGKTSTPSPNGSFHIASRVKNPPGISPERQLPRDPRIRSVLAGWVSATKATAFMERTCPSPIGKAASHGCIRMRNQDVEDLFERVEVGDPVDLVTEVSDDAASLPQQIRDDRGNEQPSRPRLPEVDND